MRLTPGLVAGPLGVVGIPRSDDAATDAGVVFGLVLAKD